MNRISRRKASKEDSNSSKTHINNTFLRHSITGTNSQSYLPSTAYQSRSQSPYLLVDSKQATPSQYSIILRDEEATNDKQHFLNKSNSVGILKNQNNKNKNTQETVIPHDPSKLQGLKGSLTHRGNFEPSQSGLKQNQRPGPKSKARKIVRFPDDPELLKSIEVNNNRQESQKIQEDQKSVLIPRPAVINIETSYPQRENGK